jgi:hypothetical protein
LFCGRTHPFRLAGTAAPESRSAGERSRIGRPKYRPPANATGGRFYRLAQLGIAAVLRLPMTRIIASVLCVWLAACSSPAAPTADPPVAVAPPTSEPAVAPSEPRPPETVVVAPEPPVVIDARPASVSVISHHRASGCGSRGGPGVRLANGRCASWSDTHHKHRHHG